MQAAPLTEALRPAIEAGAVIDRLTQWPWVVVTGYMVDDAAAPSGWRYEQAIRVVWASHADRPEAETYLPAGTTFARGEVFPASRFEDMPVYLRGEYRRHYRAWLMARKARSLGKDVDAMQSHVDYDPIYVDENVQRWVHGPGVRYCGD